MGSTRALARDRASVIPPLVLALLPFVLFAPIALVRRAFFAHDVQAYFFPYHVLPARMLAEGHLPLWNPYVFSGIPLLGDGQTAMFYPPNWLFFLLPGAAALNYVLLLQFSIAGVGMYLFARSLGLWRLPACIAAVAYMFCGFLTARVVHLSIMSGAALMPVVLFCLDRLLVVRDSPGRRRGVDARWLAGTAFALALQASAGHPQMPVYTAISAALYAVICSVDRSVAIGRWRQLASGPFLVVGAYLLGCALAAIQLVPWAEFARLSVRAAGADFEFVFRTSTAGAEWLLFVFPFLLGAYPGSWFAVGPIEIDVAVRAWEHSGYVGILPLALASVALSHFVELTLRPGTARPASDQERTSIRRRWRSLLFLVLLLLTGLLLAAGWHTPISAIVYRIPVLGSLRAVERGLVLASFAIALLAGFGLQRILERSQRRPWLLAPAVLIAAVPAAVVWYAHLWTAPDLANLSLYRPNTQVPLLLALASGLLLAWWSRRRGGAISHAVAAALVLVDLGIYAVAFNPTASSRLYQYRPQVTAMLRGGGEPFRKATVLVDRNDLVNRPAQEALAMSWGMVHGIEDINGFNSLQPRRYTDYLFGPGEVEVSYGYLRDPALFQSGSPILNSLNVRYVLVPVGTRMDLAPHFRPVYRNASVHVYENTLVYPRAYFPDRVRRELDPKSVLRHVTAPGFDGRREALVETAERLDLPAPVGPASASAARNSPDELRVLTNTAEARLLVVSEMYFPGWRAYVDGVETPLYRANYLFRGVVVPAGQHVVSFVYRPASVLIGAAASSVALLVIVALLVPRRTAVPATRTALRR